MSKVAAALITLLAACTCEPTVHVETGYASPALADSIEQCARERACTVLCSRTFLLQPGEIDSCRILELDAAGGAQVEVTYTTYTCVGDDWATDSGDDWGGDPSDPIEDDTYPDDDGTWEDDESEQDDWDDEDEDDDDWDDE